MKKGIFIACNILFSYLSIGQVGIGTTTPHNSSVLDVESTEKGFLPPRMNSLQRDAINGGNPASGLIIYNIDDNCLNLYRESAWQNLCTGSTTSPSNSNSFSSIHEEWSTDLRFRDFGYIGSPEYDSYGITTDSNLFMWGNDDYGYVHTFNQTRGSGDISISPYFIDFSSFNGQVKKFGLGSFTYAVLTEDNKVWMWGNQVNNIMGNNPSGPQNVTNGLTTPIELVLPAGESSVKDIAMEDRRIYFLTNNGNVYYRGTGMAGTGATTYLAEFAEPSGAGIGFEYTEILGFAGQISNTHLFLKGNDGKYYAAQSYGSNSFYLTGNSSAPSPSSGQSYDIRNSSNIYEIQFPAGHGNIIKIEGDRGQRVMAIDDTGKLYAWGAYSTTSGTQYFETDAINTIFVSPNNYFRTPVLVNLPTGESGYKDFSIPPSENVSYLLANSGKVYTIGDHNGSNSIGVITSNYTSSYGEILNIGGEVEKLASQQNSLMFSDGNGEIFGLGQNRYGDLGGFTNEVSGNSYRISPTPLCNGNFDPNNDNVQAVN